VAKRAFDKIKAGLEDAIAIARGEADPSTYRAHVPSEIDVRALRKRLNLTQDAFSAAFGIPLATLRDWEQSRRRPEGPARAYLLVIGREPDVVRRALAAA
jgi:putative transcriptional regulator